MTSMTDALEQTLASLDLTDADAAAVELARWYARELDAARDPDVLATIGPKLRLILSDLRVRGVAKGGEQGDDDDAGDFLAEVRQLRPGQHNA